MEEKRAALEDECAATEENAPRRRKATPPLRENAPRVRANPPFPARVRSGPRFLRQGGSSWGTGASRPTMIYIHVLNRGGRGVQSPADKL